ncbi:SusC/RagA family TonB-linked outer membrane protein [Massilibacteroides vaginae]|uniref:SusC/RagA family TonB-linked outer membrane protein n=1 Tax=Massilibacteroides vaginae TaxID=1673718 RepID=UPI000A1C9817|nr:TonB-dependent receptor [Massilibacteroides vaginae]
MMKKLTYLLLCLFMSIGLVSAQTTAVRGVVISAEDNEPIIGASILAKGTTVGTVTDLDGAFSLNVPSSAKTLVISYIGMITQEVAVSSNVRVLLQSDTQNLDEVVVTAYGTTTKGAFTGSASVLKAEKIEARQVSNLSNALTGTVAGVQVLSDNGQPGTSAKIRIRGVGSINAGMDPLYVVDGIPFDGDLSSINTQDIESMTVLKDAASTALYGARGANGIIMVTTKKGKSGKATVNFDAKVGSNSRATKNYDVMRSPQMYTEGIYQAIYNANIGTGTPESTNAKANNILFSKGGGGFGYPIYTVPTGEKVIGMDGKLNPNAVLGYNDGTYYYTPDNWEDESFVNNMRQEYNVSVSASSDKMNFYGSFGYLNDQGIIRNSGFERYAGRLKGEYKITDWFKVGGNFGYTYSNSRAPGDQDAFATASSGNSFFIANNMAPVIPMYVRGADGNIMLDKGRPVYDYGDGKSTKGNRNFMSISNPTGDLVYNKEMYLSDIMNFTWFGELTPIAGLTLTARYGLNIDNTRYNSLGNSKYGQSASYGGTAYQQHERLYGFNQQYIGNYQFTIEDDHHVDVTLGYDGYEFESALVEASGQNLYNANSYYINNTIDQRKSYGSAQRYSTEGFLGRVNYNYKDTYFGSVSFRRDGSSRFSKDNRWGSFYSASAAWMISNEDFLKEQTWLNMLKLKASFGQQGNDDLRYDNARQTRNYYPYIDQFRVTGANGIFADGTLYYKGNPDITWETSTSYNIGADFSVLNNRLSGTIEYFGRESKDMLYNKPVAPSSGYSAIPMNIGSMRNTGLETELVYQIVKNKNISWDVNLNATFIKNKILELHPDLGGQMITGTRIYEEGESMYRMYLVKYAGVDQETGEALYFAGKDDEGKPITTNNWSTASNFKEGTDDLLPTVYGGFGTSLNAYGFDFNIQFSYQLGGKIYDSGYAALMHGGSSSNSGRNWHMDIQNAWTPLNTNTNVPRLKTSDQYSNSQSDRWITSSDYLSLNNIALGYTLPKSLTEKMTISRIRVYVAADNIAVFSARQGLDPRQSFTSSTTSLYTPIRTISGGVSVTF